MYKNPWEGGPRHPRYRVPNFQHLQWNSAPYRTLLVRAVQQRAVRARTGFPCRSYLDLDIVSQTLFAASERDAVGEVGQAMGYAGKSLNAQLSQPAPLPSWVPTSTNRNIKIFLDILNNRVHGIIERRRREPNTDLDDVLSRLLNAKDDNGDALTAQEIRDAQPCAVVGQEPARF